MTERFFTFYEYRGYASGAGQSTSLSDMNLSKVQLRSLLLFNQQRGRDAIFDIVADKIVARHFVGVVTMEGLRIEILPKMLCHDHDTNHDILKNLMFMLSYTNKLKVVDADISALSSYRESFLEAYIMIYASRLKTHIIRRGVPRLYQTKVERLRALRGRICFKPSEYVNTNKARALCEYQELDGNNVFSQALKYVSINLEKLTRNASTRGLLQCSSSLLEHVEPRYVDPSMLQNIPIAGRDPNLNALLEMTIMFLKKMRPVLCSVATNEIYSIFFNMNELFEEFVYELIKRHRDSIGVATVTPQKKKMLVQATRNLCDDAFQNENRFETRADILLVRNDNQRVVIDTKYKPISSDKDHYGIQHSDVYQILAYKQVHSGVDSNPGVCLLYPQLNMPIKKEFKISGSGDFFVAYTINLSKDLSKNLPLLVEEIATLVKSF